MKNKSFAKIITTLFFIGFLFLSGNVFAGEGDIIITEIMYSPEGVDSGREWIEIHNPSDSTIFIDKKSLGLIDDPIEYKEDGKLKNTCHTFDTDLQIESGGFAVITDKKSTFLEDYNLFEGVLLDSVIKLLNSQDEIRISFDRCETWEATVMYFDKWGADGTGNTLEKIKMTSDNSESNWQESYVSGGTPGKKNSKKPEPQIYSKKIRLNELLPNPEQSPEKKNEFVELHNFGNENIDLTGWTLEDKTKSYDLLGEIIKDGYLVFYDTVTLNNNGDEIKLLNPNKEVINKIVYGKTEEGYSYSYDEKSWQWTSYITPGEENEFPEEVIYSDDIYLNEILPNPSGDEKTDEFIEIYNPSKKEIDLTDWKIKDSSKTGKYVFPKNTSIEGKKYLVIYRSDFKIALNNSGEESVYLLDPNEKIVSSITYSKAKEDVSYNFNGTKWRWSKYLTPGKKNNFNNLPALEIKVDKKAYKDVYVNFELKINDPDKDEVKVAWDFGDEHKSYKKKTKHKYRETGKFNASVKIFDGSEEVIEKFKIKVEKFPSPKVRIISLMPNPLGKDSEKEWIRVKNKSKKKVNLKNWSIATGRNSKKLVNHPIHEDLIIKPGKEATITRELSKFSLNNKKSRIELRYPNGKIAHRAKYKREENIEDDEVYEKVKGDGWKWTKDIKKQEQENTKTMESEREEEIIEIQKIIIGGKSELEEESENKIIAALYQENKKITGEIINNQRRVLGISNIKKDNYSYLFTGGINYPKRDHYAVVFGKKVFWKINRVISDLLVK